MAGRRVTDRSQVASIASNISWGRTIDRAARTLPARRAALERFEKLADPDGVLEPSVRLQMAEKLRHAHYQRMARKSAQARKRRANATNVRPGLPGATS
ncbi:hypothetical protein BST14_02645 [Mycobacterium arosiense ATCC BAA-1401 = DSM 45069]|uniref:Uncharacterized protein n=1 Tax=Mycobacterium arosiense ATCC BAA-1401 = DSM 45069 TaxID=1265311 RepID=A0A1W9ZQZ4_MYCAI|nr:hypothetical protein BST14_02645 [Mycobacterium arosiense ATCC BAA-1401 = DSM 45069]